ncbi:AraC family transcriptional regulator [Paenibacillus hexagrammi]|uniref:GyrI-like domain-containing protein n=1 Tax=Paenibacillus hexagrammi TaxID=2908839 RepID=A0ABY3SSD0_9BACL|nr:GyrI-like domain-containing protein [Paenibacillus sp. YPD9-1]UJF36066.1 GyrI-like domain-containing protein [Paenibacillus sp. YPD9-1]
MNIRFETMPNYRIAYVRQCGPYGPEHARAMDQLKKWASSNHLLNESAILLGIPQDNPQITLPEKCRYDACIVLTNDVPADGSIHFGELPGGDYMIRTIPHTADAIQIAWSEIISAVHQQGYEIENKPLFERYSGEMLSTEKCELCVPVRPVSHT